MKYYTLNGVVNGDEIAVKKLFKTREDAIDYMFKLFGRRMMNMQVDRIVEHDNKHNLEYICNDYNRFFIYRHLA